MKKKIIILTSALLILGLAIVAYSVTKSTTTLNTPDSCCAMKDCCKDGVCKMGGECCKDKDNCPMKSKDSKEMSSMNHDGDACCKDGKCSMNSDCCKDGVCKMGCCKDGKCDMQAHKKDGEATAMKGDCCKGHDSCPMMHKGENKDKKDN